IRVTRTFAGEFTVEWDKTQTGISYQLEGNATDKTFTSSNSFGIYIQQSTATFHQKHFFDNFIIKEITARELVKLNIAENIVELMFDQNINNQKALDINNYNLQPGNISPINVTSSLNTIRLQFNNLISGTYIISAEQVEGINGSLTQSPISKTFNYIKPYQAK